METKPLVLLIQPVKAVHDHTALLVRAGFRVQASADDRISERDVLDVGPDLIAVELEATRSADTLDLARRLRADPRTRSIPVILYAMQLQPEHIENAARAGILWLQIGSTDGLKLVAAVRGVLARSTSQADASKGSDRKIGMGDLGVEVLLTCPTCQSRIAIIETENGGKMVSIVGLGESVGTAVKARERVIAPDGGADVICPACDRHIDPSAQYRMHEPVTRWQ